MRIKYPSEYYNKPLEDRIPVTILRFGEKRYFGVELTDLLSNTDCVYTNLQYYNLKKSMHINITLNTTIMSEDNHYQISLMFALELLKNASSQKDIEVGNYLLTYFEEELDLIDQNPENSTHSDPESIKQIRDSYDFNNLAKKLPIFCKKFKAPSGMLYNLFMIDASAFFMELYRTCDYKDYRVQKGIKDLVDDNIKNVGYFVDGIFNKKYYLDMSVAHGIAEKYLYKNGIKKEIEPLLLNYKDQFTDFEIIKIHDLIEYLELQEY